jgi:hypothetical protein
LASCPQPSPDYELTLNTGPDLKGEPGQNDEKPDKELPPEFGKLIHKLLSSILISPSSGKKEYNFNVETSPNLKVKEAKPKQSEGVEVNGEGELRLAMPLKFLLGDSFIDLKLGGKYGANAGIEADLEEKSAPPAVPPQPSPPPVEPVNICLEPTESTDPIKTQHTFVASVTGACGAPASGQVVEWILNQFPGAVGDIMQVGPQGQLKAQNHAITITNAEGKAYLVITSTRPGDTEVTAFCPQIKDVTKHKAFAVKHWVEEEVSPTHPEYLQSVGKGR